MSTDKEPSVVHVDELVDGTNLGEYAGETLTGKALAERMNELWRDKYGLVATIVLRRNAVTGMAQIVRYTYLRNKR